MQNDRPHRQPPEWAPQRWLWIGFPYAEHEWPDVLADAQIEIAGFANAVAASGQKVRLVVRDAANAALARALIGPAIDIREHVYGDIWLRDTGPLVVTGGIAQLFGFNGWGEKYVMPGDTEIGTALAAESGLTIRKADWILEGGAIDIDGTGLAVTTEQCLLHPNRNPHLSRAEIEQRLADDLGIDRVLWLGEGLVADHTDGHVDNLARFVAPNRLAVPVASGGGDPNAAIYDDARARADASGVEVVSVPSPGRVEVDGAVVPASYMNFVITNAAVIVPIYDSPFDDAALSAISGLFPAREVVGLPARAVLAGGGSFHCASQQMPALP